MDTSAAIASLEAVLEQLDAGEVEATPSQRAYLSGALDALRSLHG